MKIQINNFGPIRYHQFDLNKDMHLIFGKNNIGKSYAITIAYLIVKTFLEFDTHYLRFLLERNALRIINGLDEIPDNDKKIEDSVKRVLTQVINLTFVNTLQKSLVATFDSIANLQNQFTSDQLQINLVSQFLTVKLSVVENQFSATELEIHPRLISRPVKRNKTCKIDDQKAILYYLSGDKASFNSHINQMAFQFLSNFFSEVTSAIDSVHYLPASRSGLYQSLSAFGQIIAELSKSRAFVKKRIELPGIPEPLSDYFLRLSEISPAAKKDSDGAVLDAIAQQIETDILKGKVDFDIKTKRIMFSPKNTKLRLDLSSTSSMVSELSPIVSYIRHILGMPTRRRYREAFFDAQKSLVIIEEPEAHLHPDIQIRIMEIFARLISSNVKIIITTHSNYIFNKGNNLIISGDINTEFLSAVVFEEGTRGSIGRELPTDELGMDDENFMPSSEFLYAEKMELIKRLNEND